MVKIRSGLGVGNAPGSACPSVGSLACCTVLEITKVMSGADVMRMGVPTGGWRRENLTANGFQRPVL